MNQEEVEFCLKNIKRINISSMVVIENETYYVDGDINKHMKFYDDCTEYPDSLLLFEYFGENVLGNKNFNDDGDFDEVMTRLTTISIEFIDTGKILLTDSVNMSVNLWIQDSKKVKEYMNFFEYPEESVDIIFEYFSNEYQKYLKNNKKEVYLDFKDIR